MVVTWSVIIHRTRDFIVYQRLLTSGEASHRIRRRYIQHLRPRGIMDRLHSATWPRLQTSHLF